MIYCVWYPSGGFGHFVNAILSLHGDGFARPDNSVTFSTNGDAHSLNLVVPKYFHDQPYPEIVLDSGTNYSVLIDNGINNRGKKFLNIFGNSKVIKLYYDDLSWPVVAKTSIIKASQSSLEQELTVDSNWPSTDPWAIREKYSLYLKEHTLRSAWTPDPDCYNLNVSTLLSYQKLKDFINSIVNVSEFESLYNNWWLSNCEYFSPIVEAVDIINAISLRQNLDLNHITNIWDQAVINYLISIKLGIDVPVNGYPNWFQDTNQISKLL
jgi:hypothetical protein